MSTLVTRSGKGSPLTHNEVDTNFTNLNTDKVEKTAADITGGTINNTTIGATTPSTGVFTTLTATGQTDLGGPVGNPVFKVFGSTPIQFIDIQGSTSGTTTLRSWSTNASSSSLLFQTRATGNFTFATGGSSGTVQAVIGHTTSAVNYVQVTGAATGGRPTVSAEGSDASVALILASKGTGSVGLRTSTSTTQLSVIHTASAVNFLQATGAVASSGPIFSANGSDTNIDLNLTTKGTGAVNLNTGGGTQVQVSNTASAVNYVELTGGPLNNAPTIGAKGSNTNISFAYSSKGTGGHDFYTSGTSFTQQVKISHTASAVNFVQVTGAATGSRPTISAAGSDSNVDLNFVAKGTSGGHIFTANNVIQAVVSPTTSAVNYLNFTGGATGTAVKILANGTDTNIPLVLQPKGTGALQAQQTDSTATGGNARGANAVDWQTSRSAASQVASGQYSAIVGGSSNTANNSFAFVGSGALNSASGFSSFVGGGRSNTAGGTPDYGTIVAGLSNTSAGFFNFIGGGFTNSGTSGSAVTTQSGTMNATTAVTLSGSNANIKVGQLVTGTSIAGYTYVAAISGTSLTLSQAASGSSTSTLSFYTPHGVVVGGGNNTATGSYSFIGGGGDAGTAANRNVASGDWSVVAGGLKSVASGQYAFVGGGSGAIASGAYAVVSGGVNNQATGFGSTSIGGYNNISNSAYSATLGGNFASTRGIEGISVFGSQTPLGGTLALAQSSLLVLAVQTTDATATVLRSNASAASTNNQIILPNNAAFAFKGTVIANVTGGGNTKAWAIEGAIKRGANAASTALVGTVSVVSAYADAGASTWAIAVTADTTNGGLAVTFTGQAATTIRCVAKLETTEVTF